MSGEKWIAVVSFNANEAGAVDRLLTDLASGHPSPWQRDGEQAIKRPFGDDAWRLEHVALRAHGNVLAAAQLAEFFQDRHRGPDYVVFYGCAGAMDPRNGESMFLVRYVNYLSLGTVQQANGHSEAVTLKNKWLCHLVPPGDVLPIEAVSFPICTPGGGPLDLVSLSGIPPARVAATDKVVRIAPAAVPEPTQGGPPQDRYAKSEWSYGQALGLVGKGPDVVVVDMESFGIGRIAEALQIQDRVVVLRVTTDTLTDHEGSDDDQRALLQKGRHMLGRVVGILFAPSLFAP